MTAQTETAYSQRVQTSSLACSSFQMNQKVLYVICL